MGLSYFVEGFDSSAITASRVLYELALNPRVQQTLHDELKGVFGEDFDPDYDSLARLHYLDQVISGTYLILYHCHRYSS